jgi:hypothetical protein
MPLGGFEEVRVRREVPRSRWTSSDAARSGARRSPAREQAVAVVEHLVLARFGRHRRAVTPGHPGKLRTSEWHAAPIAASAIEWANPGGVISSHPSAANIDVTLSFEPGDAAVPASEAIAGQNVDVRDFC